MGAPLHRIVWGDLQPGGQAGKQRPHEWRWFEKKKEIIQLLGKHSKEDFGVSGIVSSSLLRVLSWPHPFLLFTERGPGKSFTL